MSWNYRIVEYEYPYTIGGKQKLETFYRIAEVYYFNEGEDGQTKAVLDFLFSNEEGKHYLDIKVWTAEPLSYGLSNYDSPVDLIGNIEAMLPAKNKPILKESILNKIAELRMQD